MSAFLIANPKSAIFTLPSLKKILAGFRSLWTIPNLLIPRYPLMIYFRISRASLSGMHLRDLIILLRSPPSQNSVTMQVWVLVERISWTFITFWRLLRRRKIYISLLRRVLWTSPLIFFMSISFRARVYPGWTKGYRWSRFALDKLRSNTLSRPHL